ncbi:nuclear transport factor 2 family protein [Noviherbaspirillum saxi]|uniref:Nuclear transport factor 2 family protein n=1 Tax=Noviherbaspirillum saxi TaxID=2320863 RepID=A0A3A3FUR7_9BURK|nr:nuclear transport factor 2 family protein [Noviherbaspirillum saxi]RJF99310.1 nuclear transport factor 2 family protein [Noviherbaspirillum saxi]
MNEQQNTQLVQQAYAKFQAGDIPGLLEMCADDIEWELDPNDDVPFSGARHGKEAVREFFSTLDQSQQPLHFEPREFIAQGDKVVALGHYAWNVKSTDRTFESDWAEIFTIRDGKIARFREFADTAAGAAAYRSH